MKTIVILSGGLDSVTLLYHLHNAGHELKALSINYGQRHDRELAAARRICELVEIEHRVLDLRGLAGVFGSNALSDQTVEVPHGSYQERTIQVTTVPNRNMIMLSIAIGWAASLKFDAVAFGAHAGQYTPYPDCRPPFAAAMNCAAQLCDWRPIQVLSPFISWDKAAIAKRGHELGVPFELTWSCYEGSSIHCGVCATCLDRKEAFRSSGLVDPVRYAK